MSHNRIILIVDKFAPDDSKEAPVLRSAFYHCAWRTECIRLTLNFFSNSYLKYFVKLLLHIIPVGLYNTVCRLGTNIFWWGGVLLVENIARRTGDGILHVNSTIWRDHFLYNLRVIGNLTLHVPCIILQCVYKPTRCTNTCE